MNYRRAAREEPDFGALLSRTFANLRDIGREVAAYVAALLVLAFALPLAGTEITGLLGFVLYISGQYWLYRRLLATRGLMQTQRTHFLAFVALAILLILPILFGIALLVLPGLFLVARWIAAPSFIVARGDGAFAAAVGSWNAVRGSTLKVAGMVALLFALVSVIGLAATAIDQALAEVDAYRSARPGNVVQLNILPVLLLGLSVATYEMRGPNDNSIEEVFG
jgi:predicted neutral ceramidase superfamily lipid hydrolase